MPCSERGALGATGMPLTLLRVAEVSKSSICTQDIDKLENVGIYKHICIHTLSFSLSLTHTHTHLDRDAHARLELLWDARVDPAQPHIDVGANFGASRHVGHHTLGYWVCVCV
jgi:hypothetical protein